MMNKYRHMMEQLELSPEIRAEMEGRIRQAADTPRHTMRPLRWISAAAACLVLLMAVAANPTAVKALENAGDFIVEIAERLGFVSVSSSYVSDDSNYIAILGTNQDGNKQMSSSYNTDSVPDWLREIDGRLYFTGNLQRIDISDQISYEVPFTYIYTDAQQITHYIAVGGVYDSDSDVCQIGWFEYFQNAPESGTVFQEDMDGWIGGYGKQFADSGQNAWYASAVEEMKIPLA